MYPKGKLRKSSRWCDERPVGRRCTRRAVLGCAWRFRDKNLARHYSSGRMGKMNRTTVFALLLAGGGLMAQSQTQQPPNEKSGQATVQGCVSRSSGAFMLMQSDPGNSYVLRPSGKLKLDPYLGQQVEITGREAPSMASSSNRGRPAAAVTIVVESIKTISKSCG